MTQPPEDHLKALWQGQETEIKIMTAQAIRARAARYTWRKRASYLFGFALVALELVVFGHFALTIPAPLVRIGMLVVIAGLGWLVAIYSLGWPRRMPGGDASAGSLLEYHRTELQRQKIGFGTLMFMAGPVLAGVVISAVGGMIEGPPVKQKLLNLVPVFVLIAAWIVAVWFLQRRAERIRRERLSEIDATRPE